jgi:hypothetical protein
MPWALQVFARIAQPFLKDGAAMIYNCSHNDELAMLRR